MLRLTDVHAGYGRVEVLRGVDLAVPEGSVVALIGANGAGKTTLLKVAAGFIRPASGAVSLDGRSVRERRPYERARAGLCLIPEGRGVFPKLTVRDNLAMQVQGRNLKAAIERATELFPVLGQRLDQLAGTLSGGEQQMLSVARSLVTAPRVVLADELSVGLAPVVVDQIFDAVDRLRTSGCSLLIVEQYVQRVLAIADYVYVLHKGEVVFVGEPDQCAEAGVFERYVGSAVG